MQQYKSIDGALNKLREYDRDIFTQAVDVTKLDFVDGEEHGMLVTEDQKRLTLTKSSVSSLARFTKIPAGYIRQASSTLVNKSLREFGEQLKSPIGQAIVHESPVDGKFTLRGIIAEGKKHRPNALMLENVKRIFGDKVKIEHAPWSTDQHPSFFRNRIIWPETGIEVDGSPVMMGMDLLSSDVEIVQEQINLLLYRQICTNGMIAQYGGRPYFYLDNRKSSIFDYEAVIKAVSDRIGDDADQCYENIKTARDEKISPTDALDVLMELENRKKLPKSFVVKTMTGIKEDLSFKSRWDLVNAVTAQARKYKDLTRLHYETVGGHILGLSFRAEKKQKEKAQA